MKLLVWSLPALALTLVGIQEFPALAQSVRHVKGYCRGTSTAGLWEGVCNIKTRYEGNWLIVQLDERMTLTKARADMGERPGRTISQSQTFRLTRSPNCRTFIAKGYSPSIGDPGCFTQTFDDATGGWQDGGCVMSNDQQFSMSCGSAWNFQYQTTLPRPTE